MVKRTRKFDDLGNEDDAAWRSPTPKKIAAKKKPTVKAARSFSQVQAERNKAAPRW